MKAFVGQPSGVFALHRNTIVRKLRVKPRILVFCSQWQQHEIVPRMYVWESGEAAKCGWLALVVSNEWDSQTIFLRVLTEK